MKKKDKKIKVQGQYSMPMLISVVVLALIVIGFLFRHWNEKVTGDMFAYSGAIIGGGMTLIGVIITLNYNEKKRIEDKREHDKELLEERDLQYSPILKIVQPAFSIKESVVRISFKVENNGRGEANNIHFELHNLNHTDTSLQTKEKILYTKPNIAILEKGNSEAVTIDITKPIIFNNENQYSLLIIATYDSLFKTGKKTSVTINTKYLGTQGGIVHIPPWSAKVTNHKIEQ